MSEIVSSPFRHERLRVYRLALEFLGEAQTLRSAMPRGHAPLGDQLTRAAASVVLNIAEGIAQEGGNTLRHLTIARGSAAECAAALAALRPLKACSVQRYTSARKMLVSMGKMLAALRQRHRSP